MPWPMSIAPLTTSTRPLPRMRTIASLGAWITGKVPQAMPQPISVRPSFIERGA
ncbi:Uncharacterised protein [Mycobacterium tuberculosis]|nr:Uncharacterised protein [Mycobacterium tuberculosis]